MSRRWLMAPTTATAAATAIVPAGVGVCDERGCQGEPRDEDNEVCVTIDRAPQERPQGG